MATAVKDASVSEVQESRPERVPVIPIWSGFQHMNKPFADSLDHIQALEHEARVMLGLAWRRKRQSGFAEFDSEEARQATQLFGHLAQMSVGQIEKYLGDVRQCVNRREALSRKAGIAMSFLDFCAGYELDRFERDVVLLLFTSSTSRQFRELCAVAFSDIENSWRGGMSVGLLLQILARDFREQIEMRRYFSMDARLVQNEILYRHFNGYGESSGILDESFWLHQRIVDFLVGDNNTYSGALKFIARERGAVPLGQVVLPEALKREVVRHAENYAQQQSRRSELGLDEFYGYGTGLTLFFHGASGTGKTMLAHALARHLGKGLLNVRVGAARRHDVDLDDLIRYAFKEARLSNGIVLFDECDDLFNGNSQASRYLLIEIEKAACITILTTNKAESLDPALDRRISLKLYFPIPDEEQRANLWKTLLPPSVGLADDVDLNELARTYVFTGGQIKNTLIMAINSELGEHTGGLLRLGREAIASAAEYQANHIYLQAGLGAARSPQGSIEELPLRLQDKRRLRNLARSVHLLRERGLGGGMVISSADVATSAHAAEAVAAEAGFHVRIFNVSDLCNTSLSEFDPDSHDKVNPLHLAFLPFTGHRAVLLLRDDNGQLERYLAGEEDNQSVKEMLGRIRESTDIVLVVCPSFYKVGLPSGFHYDLHLGLPPEELQMRSWEVQLHPVRCPEEALVALVERYPMHLAQIAVVAREARIAALVNDGRENTVLNHLEEAIRRHAKTPHLLLFGSDLSHGAGK